MNEMIKEEMFLFNVNVKVATCGYVAMPLWMCVRSIVERWIIYYCHYLKFRFSPEYSLWRNNHHGWLFLYFKWVLYWLSWPNYSKTTITILVMLHIIVQNKLNFWATYFLINWIFFLLITYKKGCNKYNDLGKIFSKFCKEYHVASTCI